MNVNKSIEIVHEFEKQVWVERVNQARVEGKMTAWISTLHPEKLRCELDGNFMNGSYNLGQKIRFSDGTTEVLRMPIVGSICDKLADEKIAIEVEVLSLLRGIDIPVPHVKAWGLAADNPLGLGPYILMSFIEGVSANTLLRENQNSRLLKEDISDDDVKFLYRQFARILFQMFQMDFSVLGSLPTPVTQFNAPVRPLTFKVHDILQTGGVNTFGMRPDFLPVPFEPQSDGGYHAHSLSRKEQTIDPKFLLGDRTGGFSDTIDYFHYLAGQDWSQFQYQPNSGGGPTVTQAQYAALRALQAVIPELVEQSHAHGPYKLICDDLGLANLIVRSADDLTVVGLVDFEWSYAGPAQLYASAPWWLLQDRLNNWDTFLDSVEAPRVLERYFRHLQLFKAVLEEEEWVSNQQAMEFSRLLSHSEESGSMWLHILLSWGFNHPDSLPFAQLRAHLGEERWDELEQCHRGIEAQEFAERKRAEREKYDDAVERTESLQKDVEDGKMTQEAFLAETIYEVTGAHPNFQKNEVKANPQSSSSYLGKLFVASLSKIDVALVANAVKDVKADNSTAEWDCQEYVIDIIDKLKDELVLDEDDEDYKKARRELKKKRGATV